MVKVKICGITNLDDALHSIDSGCDALGFVFYKKSSRYISPGKAAGIIRKLPKKIVKIGVFANSREKRIKDIAKSCNLNVLQFHGNESARFCRRFKKYKIIKAFRIKDRIDVRNVSKYKTFAYLFDTFVKSKIGGTGKIFNWKFIRHINGIKRPIFLSGGLNARNVKRAIRMAGPDWVDVSGGVESSPGKKDYRKVKRFIKAAKSNG